MTSDSGSRSNYQCSFCYKGQEQVQRLIAGPEGVFICDECVITCQRIMTEEMEQGQVPPEEKYPTPKTPQEIFAQRHMESTHEKSC